MSTTGTNAVTIEKAPARRKAPKKKTPAKKKQAASRRNEVMGPLEPGPPPSELQQLVAQIGALARDKDVDAAKVQVLLSVLTELRAENARLAYHGAMHAMQPHLPRLEKTRIIWTNRVDARTGKPVIEELSGEKEQVEQSRYAPWEEIDPKIRPILHAYGFSLTFEPVNGSDGLGRTITVYAVLRHVGGHETRTPAPALPMDPTVGKNNPVKGWGSAASYGKRYAATMALNLVTVGEDDDGRDAGAPDAGKLDEEQLKELKQLICDSGANLNATVGLFRVKELVDIPVSEYEGLKARLQAKIAARKK